MASDFPFSAFMNIGFSHHYAILSKVKDVEQRKFYIQFAADTKVKVEDLEKLIEDDLYSHQGNLPNNFKRTIPDQLQAYRAITMFKDEYLLDYINTEELFVRDKDRDERVIEQSIINNVKNFIMTFGRDFTFVGNQYHLEKFGVEQFLDLLFFNSPLLSHTESPHRPPGAAHLRLPRRTLKKKIQMIQMIQIFSGVASPCRVLCQ